jgi:putative flavoprotein involved in K+ transport
VIGGGHAGLAASHFLSEHSVDHVVLERGEVANSWRHERWDSLTLLTPNWLSRLPGLGYDGPDPDGYMGSADVAELIARFAAVSRAPLRTGTEVRSLRRSGDGYRLLAGDDEIQADTVVIASGACNLPAVPALAAQLPDGVLQVTAHAYRNPDELPDGGVLVVGASATGVQIAAELQRSGRPVTLAVGEHVRMPRSYRGRDVLWWMEASGVWDQRHDELDDLTRARALPSPQLVGTPERVTLDLNALTALGVELVGRLATIRDGRALFSGGLRNVFALADLKLERLLDFFDEWALEHAPAEEFAPPERLVPTVAPRAPRLQLDLAAGEIGTVLWATGFRPDYGWLDIPVLDAKGSLRHHGGVVDSPGLYALGLPVLRRRKSTFIHGIADDAREVIGQLAAALAGSAPARLGGQGGLNPAVIGTVDGHAGSVDLVDPVEHVS